jgi:ABC-type sugar transport system permease subunit
VWEYLFSPYLGPLSALATRLGLEGAGFSVLGDSRLVLAGIMAAFLWRYLGFNMVVYLAGLKSISSEYYEAADLDGVTWLGRLRHITWPLLMPQTFVLVVLTTIGTLQLFDLVWIMTQGGPANASQTVGTYLYTTAFQDNDLGYAEAMAFILFAIVALLGILEMGLLRRRVERITRP